MRVAVLACLLSAMVAMQPPKRSSAELDPECFRPLEEFCLTDKCHAYKAELSALRGDGDCYGRATMGRCGPHRITHRSDGFASTQTRYFDKAGQLVAVRTEHDVMTGNPACPNWSDQVQSDQHHTIVQTLTAHVERISVSKLLNGRQAMSVAQRLRPCNQFLCCNSSTLTVTSSLGGLTRSRIAMRTEVKKTL